jgi:TonB family protein
MTEKIVNSVDAKSWGISIGLHVLLMLIMLFWAAFPDIQRLPTELEITIVQPAEEQVRRFATVARIQPRQENVATSTPRRAQIPSVSQPSARQAPARDNVARDPGPERAAPSTPVPPREVRGGADPVDFMDFGGGMQERSSGATTGEITRRESREQGHSTSMQSSDNVVGAGSATERAITADPGTLSATPRSSANIQWDGGLARNRIAGILPAFPPGSTRDAQISVRFRVRPDGSMYGMTVIQKGEAAYERAALDAMRTWKFNALPESAQQADQVGTATFVFKVR